MSQQSGDLLKLQMDPHSVDSSLQMMRYQSKTRKTVQSQNTMIKQRKMRTLRNVSRANTRLRDECVCECGLRSPIDEHQVNNQSPGTG